MSAFLDGVMADIDNVFLNQDEFAEVHNINGKDIVCVMSVYKTQSKSAKASSNFDGLHGNQATINLKKSDLSTVPAQGQNIHVDGKLYKVTACRDNMGMLTIMIGGYRMGGAG